MTFARVDHRAPWLFAWPMKVSKDNCDHNKALGFFLLISFFVRKRGLVLLDKKQ